MIAFIILMTQILPRNQEIFTLGRKMNNVPEQPEEDQEEAENYAEEIKNYLSELDKRNCSYLG